LETSAVLATFQPRTARRRSKPFLFGQSIAVAAWSGLALAIAAPAAMAAPAPATPQVEVVETGVAAVSPTVVVPADAEWTLAAVEVTGEKPAPPPVVVLPAAAPERGAAASRSTSRTAVSAAPAAAPASASAGAVLSIARQYIGVPYVYGGTTPAGFDCSGFTQYVFAKVGVALPRTSTAQRGAGVVVPASQAQPGDLVWWPGHIGIYTGNGQHIAARRPGTPLQEGPVYGANPVYIRVL
jgi:cell wall-associated NlpC family hydrolase